MKNCRLPQEGLKWIACITMLIDHLGAVFFHDVGWRLAGRLSFPIYCFLLAEGAHYTRNQKQYGLRLLLGLLLSEIPFDLLFFGRLTLEHQSVMVTLLLGYLYAVTVQHVTTDWRRILLLIVFAIPADILNGDYGGAGVAMIGLFVLTREDDGKWWKRALGLAALSWAVGGMSIRLGQVMIPIQVFSMVSLIPIYLYDGSKRTGNLWVQRFFYLFYPVHLLVLYAVKIL